MKATEKIYKNSLIYSIGNLGSRGISFIFYPLYSYYLTTAEYGTYDVIIATISLLMPLLTFHIPESIVKYLGEEKKNTVISSSLVMAIICFTLSIFVSCIYIYIEDFSSLLIVWISVQVINQYLLYITRGLGKNIIYSLCSIISSCVTVVSNIVLLICLRMGINALIYSGVLAELITMMFLVKKSRLLSYLSLSKVSKTLIKKMVLFSIPLIPSGMIWWIMNTSDKYIINAFMSVEANGIYAISYKFPTFITLFYGFYNLAWQDFLYSEKEVGNYKQVIDQFLGLVITVAICVMYGAKIVCVYIVNKSYYESYLYIPPIVIGMVFYCFSGFFGVQYRKKAETRKEATSSILGAITNIAINILFIKKIGLWAAAISTMLAFFVVFIIRYRDAKIFLGYRIMTKENILKFIALLIFCALYYIESTIATFALLGLGMVIFLLVNKSMLMDLFTSILKK